MVLIVTATVVVGIEFGSGAAWGLGALLFALWAAIPAILQHVSGASPPSAPVADPDIKRPGADAVQSLRDLRRPYYSDAIAALGVLCDRFDEVREWVSDYAKYGRSDKDQFIIGRGHPTHTPLLHPLVAAVDAGVREAGRAVQAMELAGNIPENVLRDVSWYVRRADDLLLTVKGGYIVKPERHARWLNDAEQLQFAIYPDAIGAMKRDLRSPGEV